MEENEAFLEKFQAQRANWKDIEDVKRINLEFINWSQKSDWIEIWILHMSRYFDHNFPLKYRIEVIPAALES
jgi:hypothetical protein